MICFVPLWGRKVLLIEAKFISTTYLTLKKPTKAYYIIIIIIIIIINSIHDDE